MRGEPNIASVAALIGDPARAAILMALADGRALPAGELAAISGLSPSAASAHLTRLLDGGLLALEREGRHRYFRLSGPGVAEVLESLASLIPQPPAVKTVLSPKAQALRYARSCYDHLAGELGVAIAQALQSRGLIASATETPSRRPRIYSGDPGVARTVRMTNSSFRQPPVVPALGPKDKPWDDEERGKGLVVTAAGTAWFKAVFAIDVAALKPGRHGIACRCLDWTERRHHIAGPLGARLLQRCCDLGWLTRERRTRAVQVTAKGRERLRAELGVEGR